MFPARPNEIRVAARRALSTVAPHYAMQRRKIVGAHRAERRRSRPLLSPSSSSQHVEEWRDDFGAQRAGDAKYDGFWHRKSHKIVLAVLAVSTSPGEV